MRCVAMRWHALRSSATRSCTPPNTSATITVITIVVCATDSARQLLQLLLESDCNMLLASSLMNHRGSDARMPSCLTSDAMLCAPCAKRAH